MDSFMIVRGTIISLCERASDFCSCAKSALVTGYVYLFVCHAANGHTIHLAYFSQQ